MHTQPDNSHLDNWTDFNGIGCLGDTSDFYKTSVHVVTAMALWCTSLCVHSTTDHIKAWLQI